VSTITTARPASRASGGLRTLWAGYGPLPALLLILTAVTGVVDAVSILALGRVFVANMTGNVVFAGFAIAGAPGFSLSSSLFALAGFLAGAAAGGTLITRTGQDRAALLRAGVVAELAFAAAALAVAAASGAPAVSHGTTAIAGSPFGAASTDAIAALLAAGMGIQNAVARKLAIPDLTTTVLTMTLTGIGADLRGSFLAGQPGRKAARAALGRRLLAVAIMLASGITSAWLVLDVSTLAALSLATALLTITTVAATAATRRRGPWRATPPPARRPPVPATPAGLTAPATLATPAAQISDISEK
jgi:uncharacterized membrane protein YoaK (UPF0700 family)